MHSIELFSDLRNPFFCGPQHLVKICTRCPLVELLVLHGPAARAVLLGAAMSSRRPLI